MQAQDTDRRNNGDGSWSVQCCVCERWFEAKRSDASYCSNRCRKTAHFAPQRLQAALEDLAYMAKRADEIAAKYHHNQAVFDQLAALRASLKASMGRIETEWQQESFVGK